MNLHRVIPLTIAALIGLSTMVLAQENLLGRWRDNIEGINALGPLTISKDRIAFGRKVTYRVKPAGAFGDGELYEVTGMNRKADPVCDTRFIIVQPSPPDIGGPTIRVFFYSGRSAPTVESINNDIAVCQIHPFSRPLNR